MKPNGHDLIDVRNLQYLRNMIRNLMSTKPEVMSEMWEMVRDNDKWDASRGALKECTYREFEDYLLTACELADDKEMYNMYATRIRKGLFWAEEKKF